jgi:hypothetical protein
MGVGHGQSKKVGDTRQGSRKEAQVVPKMKASIKLNTRSLTNKIHQEKDEDSAREKRDRPASNHAQRQYVTKTDKRNTLKSVGDQQGDQKAMDSCNKSSASSIEQSVIQKTSKGEPLCKLCVRKFRTLEHLHRHEALSDLYKDNLKKASLIAKRQTGAPKEENPVQDEDSAKKRRLLNEGSNKVL